METMTLEAGLVQVEGAEFAYAELDGRSYCAYFKKQA